MAKYVLFDTETTGTTEHDRVIQFGSMIIDQDGSVEVFNEFCDPKVEISIGAMSVHNITPDLIIGKPLPVETGFYKRLDELNSNENYLIAHNISFDLDMIKREGFVNQYQLIDTLRCSRHIIESQSHGLQFLRYGLGLYLNEAEEAAKHNIVIKAHDAIGDVLVMKLFLSKLVSECKAKYPGVNPMAKLVELTKTPVLVKVFKFGKHKDKEIAEVAKTDAGYLNWMLSNMEMDEDLRFSVNYYLGN